MKTGSTFNFAKSRQRWLLPLLASVIFVYAYVCTAGNLRMWKSEDNYYDLLAEGFRSGHLYVPFAISKRLLSRHNPFAFVNRPLWLWDGSLYKNRYYLYWGPAPGVLLALFKSALQIQSPVGDSLLSFVGFSVAAIFGALIVDRAGTRLFGAVPAWLRGVAIVAFAMTNPTPFLLASGSIYVASIACSQAFVLGGLLFAFDAVWQPGTKRVDWRLLVAGTLWALATCSRVTMGLVVGLCSLLTAVATAWPLRAHLRRAVETGLILLAPIACGAVGLLVYNELRFDSWLEFGVNYQTTTLRFRLSPSYWWSNIYSYALRPFFPDCHFPYLTAPFHAGPRVFPEGKHLPDGYLINEPLVGFLRAAPLTWLIPIVPFDAAERWRALRTTSGRSRGSSSVRDPKSLTFLWLVSCLLVLSSVSGMPAIGMYMATMRYLADFTNALVLLGILGAFAVFSRIARARVRVAASLLFGGIALATLTLGLLFGYQGYFGHFNKQNPELDRVLVDSLSVCSRSVVPAVPVSRAPSRQRAE